MKALQGTSATNFVLAPNCQERLNMFRARHRVREYRNSYHNLFRLFQQGGALPVRVKELLQRYWYAEHGMLGDAYGYGTPFDHVELWGKGGKPLFLVGHPYQLSDEAKETLKAIRALSMIVRVSDPSKSWYTSGTLQVVVHCPHIEF